MRYESRSWGDEVGADSLQEGAVRFEEDMGENLGRFYLHGRGVRALLPRVTETGFDLLSRPDYQVLL